MSVKDEIMKTVEQMDMLLERRKNLVKLLAQQDEDLKEIEIKTSGVVVQNPLLTNETKRKAAIFEELEKNEQYIKEKEINRSTKDELDEVETEIEQKRFRMKGYDLITRPLW
jgi:predicted HNH restriction endonuclease